MDSPPGPAGNNGHETRLQSAASPIATPVGPRTDVQLECCGLCIVAYLTLDSAQMELVPGAMNTPGAERHMSFSWWLLD